MSHGVHSNPFPRIRSVPDARTNPGEVDQVSANTPGLQRGSHSLLALKVRQAIAFLAVVAVAALLLFFVVSILFGSSLR